MFHFIDSDNRLQWDIGAFHAGKFGLEPFLGGVDNNGGSLTENDFRNFDEGEHVALMNLAGMKLIDIALVVEGYPVDF